MIRFVMIASLLAGCRISLESEESAVCQVSTTSASCLAAAASNKSDLAWIETEVFRGSCASSSSCHDGLGTTTAGRLDLTEGNSHAALVNRPSRLDPSRMLVVPNDVNASYLMVMLQAIPLDEATPPADTPSSGFMPDGSPPLCCQELDAIERWILAGAPIN